MTTSREEGSMIAAQEAAHSAETVRLVVIMIGVTVAFFWRALIRVVLALLVVILVTTVVVGAFALTHPNML
jgi:MFS superfamily sulfate permease-like transporter